MDLRGEAGCGKCMRKDGGRGVRVGVGVKNVQCANDHQQRRIGGCLCVSKRKGEERRYIFCVCFIIIVCFSTCFRSSLIMSWLHFFDRGMSGLSRVCLSCVVAWLCGCMQRAWVRLAAGNSSSVRHNGNAVQLRELLQNTRCAHAGVKCIVRAGRQWACNCSESLWCFERGM